MPALCGGVKAAISELIASEPRCGKTLTSFHFFGALGAGLYGNQDSRHLYLAERNMKWEEKVDKIKEVNTRTLAFGNGNNANVVRQL